MQVSLAEIPGAFHLPRPNWLAIRTWVEEKVSEVDRKQVWTDIVYQWLDHLDEALGRSYQAVENAAGNLILFASKEEEDAEYLLKSAETGLAALVDALGPLAGENWWGPLVILLFAEEAALPSWSRFHLAGEAAEELRAFWRDRGLNEFWWGKGFHSVEGFQEPSYRLAQVLFRLLLADHRRKLPDFIRAAREEDSGDDAARTCLGFGLSELAAQFLGPGNWAPMPQDCWTFYGRAELHFSERRFDRALADLNECLRLDARFAPAFDKRGCVHEEMGDFAAASTDFEQAVRLDPNEPTSRSNLAFLSAACPDSAFRNGRSALEHAAKACELTGYGHWYCLGALAAAYAEVGDFEEAIRYADEVCLLCPESERCRWSEILHRFGQGLPYRKPGAH